MWNKICEFSHLNAHRWNLIIVHDVGVKCIDRLTCYFGETQNWLSNLFNQKYFFIAKKKIISLAPNFSKTYPTNLKSIYAIFFILQRSKVFSRIVDAYVKYFWKHNQVFSHLHVLRLTCKTESKQMERLQDISFSFNCHPRFNINNNNKKKSFSFLRRKCLKSRFCVKYIYFEIVEDNLWKHIRWVMKEAILFSCDARVTNVNEKYDVISSVTQSLVLTRSDFSL